MYAPIAYIHEVMNAQYAIPMKILEYNVAHWTIHDIEDIFKHWKRNDEDNTKRGQERKVQGQDDVPEST